MNARHLLSPSSVFDACGRPGFDAGIGARDDLAAWSRATRAKPCKPAGNPMLRAIVEQKLAPALVAEADRGWLKLTYAKRPEMQVSHGSIYRALYAQSRGALRKALTRYRTPCPSPNDQPRPRTEPGNWERDLDFGKHMSPVATLVERKARFPKLVGLPGGNHQADAVADARDHHPAQPVREVADPGPGPRDGATPAVHHRDRDADLLRRPQVTVAVPPLIS